MYYCWKADSRARPNYRGSVASTYSRRGRAAPLALMRMHLYCQSSSMCVNRASAIFEAPKGRNPLSFASNCNIGNLFFDRTSYFTDGDESIERVLVMLIVRHADNPSLSRQLPHSFTNRWARHTDESFHASDCEIRKDSTCRGPSPFPEKGMKFEGSRAQLPKGTIQPFRVSWTPDPILSSRSIVRIIERVAGCTPLTITLVQDVADSLPNRRQIVVDLRAILMKIIQFPRDRAFH